MTTLMVNFRSRPSNMFLLLCLLCQLIFCCLGQDDFDSDNVNPAFKIHLTTKGLNFVSRIAKSMLIDFLKDGSQKTIETKNADGVLLKWSNLKIQKYNDDMKSDVVFSPGIGVEYRLRDLNVKLVSDFAVVQTPQSNKGHQVHGSSPSGVLTETMSGVSVSLLIAMLNTNGRMKPFLEDCRCTIDKADLQVTKGSAKDLNKYFKDDAINGQARSFLQNQVCIFARTIFLPKIEHSFANYPVTVKLFDDIYYNYSLTEDPTVNSDNVITSYAGNAFIRKQNGQNDSRVPFIAGSIVDENCQERMMCLYMSNYTLRSLLYFMGKQHRFDYNFTKTDTPNFAKYLRVECSKDEICAGSVLTSLPKKYPNSNLEIYIRQVPGREQVILKQGLVNMSSESVVTGYIRRNGKKEFLFSANLESYTTMKKPIFVVSNYTIDTKFDANHFRLYNVTSSDPDVSADSLSLLTGFAMDNYVTPDLKRTLGRGLRLPKLIEFDMVNGAVSFEDGRIVAASDFCQTTHECQKAEQEANAEKEKNKKPDSVYDSVYES